MKDERQRSRRTKQVAVCLLCFFLSSCEKEPGYRFLGIPEEEDVEASLPSGDGVYPTDGSLAFYENFQSWKREGYDNPPNGDCEAEQMTTAMVMYVPSSPRMAAYEGFSVAYTLKDFALNPLCGVQTDGAEVDVSPGFVALQQTIFYECGQHDSDALMLLSTLPSVSQLRFSVSLGGKVDDVAGVSLWKRVEDAGAFTKVGDYLPTDPKAGEVFSVEINAEQVQLKFTPALTGRETPVNDGVNRAVRIHDLWVWSMKKNG
ncbi:MAG: hypothetical protein LBQ65_08545 [Tannerellaceae bacterium]|jgi:hypothetical protein|nr:hypothetical protein [Tannerellaceae bacterium]